MYKLAFIGAGSHSDAVFPIINFSTFHFVGYFDDKNISEYNSFKIIGKINDALQAVKDGVVDFLFIAIGENEKRCEIYNQFEGYHDKLVNIIAPSATILNKDAIQGNNIFVGYNSFIGAQTVIKSNSIVNTGCIIEHHSTIDKHCNIAPRSTINGIVRVKEKCYLGSGSIVIQGLIITENTFIGAGGIVVKDLQTSGLYVGNPVKMIKKYNDELKKYEV